MISSYFIRTEVIKCNELAKANEILITVDQKPMFKTQLQLFIMHHVHHDESAHRR